MTKEILKWWLIILVLNRKKDILNYHGALITRFNMKTPEQMIDNVIMNFDFAYCHKVMELTNWGWYDINIHGCIVPSLNELKRTARKLRSPRSIEVENPRKLFFPHPHLHLLKKILNLSLMCPGMCSCWPGIFEYSI